MPKLTITDPATGQQYPAFLPTGWHEVPLSSFQQFARLQAGRRPELAMLSSVQALTGVPAEVLESDVSLSARLGQLMPWFFAGLPEGEPAPTLTHRGISYEWQGDFSRLTAGQFEALLSFLDAAEGKPAEAAAELLAVLLVRTGRKQDAQAVREATAAFASLPMADAWPYVANFLQAWMMPATIIQASLVAKEQTSTALLLTNQALTSLPKPAGALRRLCSRTLGALASRYARFAAGQLTSS